MIKLQKRFLQPSLPGASPASLEQAGRAGFCRRPLALPELPTPSCIALAPAVTTFDRLWSISIALQQTSAAWLSQQARQWQSSAGQLALHETGASFQWHTPWAGLWALGKLWQGWGTRASFRQAHEKFKNLCTTCGSTTGIPKLW